MKIIRLLTLCIWISGTAQAQFYFPLEPGNWWSFFPNNTHVACEGNFYIASVIKDSIIAGNKYSFTKSLFPSRFVRQVGKVIFAYDTTETKEYKVVDLLAIKGDTISARSNKSKFIIAGGNMTFIQYDTTLKDPFRTSSWVVRDSFGIVMMSGGYCGYESKNAFINGRTIILNVKNQSMNLNIPTNPILEQNYPNPFNPSTCIKFAIPSDSKVVVEIYNSTGSSIIKLLDKNMSAGWYSIIWNASSIASGTYYCQLTVGKTIITKTMVLIK